MDKDNELKVTVQGGFLKVQVLSWSLKPGQNVPVRVTRKVPATKTTSEKIKPVRGGYDVLEFKESGTGVLAKVFFDLGKMMWDLEPGGHIFVVTPDIRGVEPFTTEPIEKATEVLAQ